MLCVNKYKQEYIDECRSNMESQFASYRTLLAAAKAKLICTSLLQNHGMMCTDKTNNKRIKYSPEKSLVKLNIGDEIKLTESAFMALFRGFFAEIETRFV